jgi:hypothetical protein
MKLYLQEEIKLFLTRSMLEEFDSAFLFRELLKYHLGDISAGKELTVSENMIKELKRNNINRLLV